MSGEWRAENDWMKGVQPIIALLAALPCVLFGVGLPAGASAASDIPKSRLEALDAALTKSASARSAARKRLSVRRLIREGESLLEAHPGAPSRFRLLGTLYRARQQLLGLDGSRTNREALLDICRRLVKAPDEYAEERFDADLLLSQTELARGGATPTRRAAALRSFLERYRGTRAEKRMLQTLTVMTLELGNDTVLADVREAISERFWSDLKMVRFMRDKFGGHVMSAPFRARLKAADGTTAVYPMDRLGRSTVFFFWSKDTEDLDARIAKWNTLAGSASGPKDPAVTHRASPGLLDIISLNLDELPDAGASILRDKGVDWQALHLPGGRKSEIYRTYARWDPMGLHVSPTGCAALLLPGLHKHDYPRRVWSYMQRDEYYLRQLEWLFIGEFLVVDPTAEFDPSAPPELKTGAAGKHKGVLLSRTEASVPADVLREIQACFVAPPLRYRLSREQALENYREAEALCREAIAAHPEAPDLWLVHNRLIVSLMGQWKLTCDGAFLARAGEASRVALELGAPAGTDVVPRLCLARLALREAGNDEVEVIERFVQACGGERKSGAAVAASAYLALDVGSRALHTRYRRVLLDDHDGNPMVWPVAATLLDRFHRYQLFMHPYFRGWSFGRRAARYYRSGTPQDATRVLHAEFRTLAGGTVRFPDKAGKAWNMIYFERQLDEGTKKRVDALRGKGSRGGILGRAAELAEKRDPGELKAWIAFLGGDPDRVAAALDDSLKKWSFIVPDGLRNPVAHRLGIFKSNVAGNIAILRPDGTIAVTCSGLARGSATVLRNALELADEAAVDAALAGGDIETARRIALRWAPAIKASPGAKRPPPGPSQVYLRCRAKVYIAMKKWKLALADVDSLVDRQRRADVGLSLESPDLLEALRLQATVHEKLGIDNGTGREER